MEHNKPQPTPRGTGREITPLVIQDLEMRSAMGKEKYGEALRAFNGRNPLVDLYQELIDAVQYIRQLIEEQQNPRMTAREFIGRRDAVEARRALEERLIAEGHTTREKLDAEQAEIMDKLQKASEWMMRNANIMETVQGSLSPESIAQEAHRLVLGDRGEAYGHPIFDMTRTADMFTALLRDKLRPGARLEAEDIAQVMICVKQSRERNKHKRDNQTDTAGYALTKEMIAEWRSENPGVDPRDVFPAE